MLCTLGSIHEDSPACKHHAMKASSGFISLHGIRGNCSL